MSDSAATRPHLQPSREAIRAFTQRDLATPVTMLNLLRFRDVADYAASPELAPPAPISGAAAYARYMAHARPFIERVGGHVVWSGRAEAFLIGPGAEDERWDAVLLVRYPDVAAFVTFTSDPGYLARVGLRTAALADSRLLPMVEGDLTAP